MAANEQSDDGLLSRWIDMPGWTVEEQAALLLGLNPDIPIPEGRTDDYQLLMRFLIRAEEMRLLKSPMNPSMFIEWAKNNPSPIQVPAIFDALLSRDETKKWRRIDSIIARRSRKAGKKGSKWPSGPSYATVMSAVLAMAIEKYRYQPGTKGSAPKNISITIGKRFKKPPTPQTVHKLLKRAEAELKRLKRST